MDKLKPCPFCGGTKLHVESFYMSNKKYVECENNDCECAGPVDLGESGAIEKWNARAGTVRDIIVTQSAEAVAGTMIGLSLDHL